MRSFALVAACVCASMLLRAQEQIEVQGEVRSGNTGKPLGHVLVRSGIQSVRTRVNGTFQITATSDKPLVIYTDDFYRCEVAPSHFASGQVVIYLTPSADTRIEGTEVETIYNSKNEHVIDYTFIADTLVLVTSLGIEPEPVSKKYAYSAINSFHYGEQLARRIVPQFVRNVSENPLGTFLLGQNTFWQLHLSADKIHLSEVSYEEFKNGIEPILAIAEGQIYFKAVNPLIPITEYWRLSIDSNQSFKIRDIRDPAYFARVADDYYMLTRSERARADSLAQVWRMPPAYFAPYIRSFYLPRVMPNVRSESFLESDTFYIADFDNQWLYKHSPMGTAYDSLPLMQNDLETEELLTMLPEGGSERKWLLYDKAGVGLLRQFKYELGAAGTPFQLSHPFPKHVSIKEGYVYYVYRDPLLDQRQALVREKLPFK